MPIDALRRGATAQAPSGGNDDPVIAAYVERAVAPYRGVLAPDALEELSELLEDMLATHPAVAPVVDRLRDRSPPSNSGAQPKRQGGSL